MNLLAALQSYQSNPLEDYDPTQGCDPFHRDTSLLRLLRAPNQIGKTYAGCAEDWWFLLDTHPYRPRHGIKAPKLVILIAQVEKFYREFCEKLHALEPPDVLAPSCRYVPGVGYKGPEGAHILILRNGASAVFVGGEGQSIGGAGGTAHALHIDEPPKEAHLEEAMRAVMHFNGPIWGTLTPVGRPVAYFKLRVEGDREAGIEPMEQWSQTVPELTVEACRTVRRRQLTRDRASIQRQINAYTGTPNAAQRLKGAWDGVATGRRFPGYHPTKHYVDCVALLKGINLERIRLAVDYGEHPDTLISGLIVEAKGGFYVLSERAGRDNGLPSTIARDMADMCREWGIPLTVFAGRDGASGFASIHGDINSLGLSGGGLSANEALAAALPGAGFPPDTDVWAPAAGKGRGSVLSGETAIGIVSAQDRLYVHLGAKRVHHSLSYHVAGQQDTKHAIDMVRYGVGDRMIATMGRSVRGAGRVVAV